MKLEIAKRVEIEECSIELSTQQQYLDLEKRLGCAADYARQEHAGKSYTFLGFLKSINEILRRPRHRGDTLVDKSKFVINISIMAKVCCSCKIDYATVSVALRRRPFIGEQT